MSDYTKKLPLEVEVKYFLDGKEVKPGDVVGKDGNLKVQYTVRNVTGKPQEVSFDDGTGKTTSATEDVVIPTVGSLTTILPDNFTDVRSGEANMAGDGHGGTKMSFTMTLFGPIGKPEATFGYEARVTDGVIPKASISALPVSPLDSPSFKGGADSYKGGAQTGATLTAGGARLKVVKRIVRCAATNVDPNTAVRDLDIPHTLMRELGHMECGIYAEVVRDGEVAVGDALVA